MSPDGITLSLIVKELQELLLQGRVEKILQPEQLVVIITIRRPGASFHLLLSAQAENARVHLTNREKGKKNSSPPLFCLVLRKHLEGSRLIKIEQEDLDRILYFTFSGIGETGELQEKILVVEIMGKHSNIILVDPKTRMIIDGIKRYSHALSRHREVLPGRPYIAPPAQNKVDPRHLDEESFREILLRNPLEKRVEEIIFRNIAGIGPTLAREIVTRAGLDGDLCLEFCGEHELRVLWSGFQKVVTPLLDGNYQPTLIFDNNRPVCFAPLPLEQYSGFRSQPQETINQAIDLYYQEKIRAQQFQQLLNHLRNTVEREWARCLKKLDLQEEARSEAEQAEKYRILGETLLAHLHLVSRGQKEAVFPNIYNPEGPPVKIELNPALTPAENAQQIFRRYNKARNTLKIIEKQISQTQDELQYLASVRTALEQAETLEELEEIRAELEEAGYLQPKTREGKKNHKRTAKPQILRLRSRDGFEILVGKNNKQNDYITMRLAKSEDLWLHVKDAAGAHVVIKSQPGREIPLSTLEQAAKIAAYYSEARNSSKVPVDYTKRKNVSKPQKARPGFVVYENYETILVNPELPENKD
ncbi:MAG: Fibronectin-binding A domain-containing protein [Thermoanaerobacterales bacterium 50_218]|nr:MAG: Fibronectin-binding A domain-containing protein [Thermoanaerobacterales bacterium 50_218]HAA89257.1 fibronectin/fibrinogen-binding protein [Peptococcaceae bacterium]